MLVWAEGAGKLHYTPGEDSCGASLSEMADRCSSLGMVNGVNLDGGGSTVMYVGGSVVNKPAVQGGIPLSNTLTVSQKQYS